MSERIIHLWGTLRPLVGGATFVKIDAATIAELFARLIERYPGMEVHIQRGVAVSINGEIYRDNWGTTLPVDAEIYLMPRVPGG